MYWQHVNPLTLLMPSPWSRKASVSSSPAPGATAAASTGTHSQHAGVASYPVAEGLAAAEAAALTFEEKGQHN